MGLKEFGRFYALFLGFGGGFGMGFGAGEVWLQRLRLLDGRQGFVEASTSAIKALISLAFRSVTWRDRL